MTYVDVPTSSRHTLIRLASGLAFAEPPVGGGILLEDETAGFATDFLHPVDAERVAVKVADTATYYAVNDFIANASTSAKMVYDSAGVLRWSPHNTCFQSQTFDNATWAKTAGTVSANVIAAPDGTTTADAFVPNVGTGNSFTNNTIPVTNGVTNTFSVYMKNGTLGNNWVRFAIVTPPTREAWFNLATGAKGASTGSPTDYTITAVGSGWYRLTMTFPAAAVSVATYLAPETADANTAGVTGNGTSPAMYLWGAQMNLGTVPTTYVATTTAARIGLAIDYDPVTHAAKGLLVEPAATNLCPESAMGRSGFLWSGNSSTFTGGQSDPSGGSEALQVQTTGNAGNNVAKSVSVVNGTTYTRSAWCKGTAGQQIFFDSNSAAAQVLVTFTGAWQRVSTTSAATTTGLFVSFELFNRSGGAHLPNVTFQTWGAQLETGSVATSYIPILAAAVTRAADNISVTTTSINYSATAGSWWVDVHLLAGSNNGRIIGYDTVNAPPIYVGGDTAFNMYDTTVLSKTVTSTLGVHKVASAFQASDRAITADGLTVASDTGATSDMLAPTFGIVTFGIGSGASINGYIRKVRYLPRRPSNAEMQTMTT